MPPAIIWFYEIALTCNLDGHVVYNFSKAADKILEQVQDLNMKLSEARLAQNYSMLAIENAKESMEAIKKSLKMVSSSYSLF